MIYALGTLAAIAVALHHPFGRKILLTMGLIIAAFCLWMIATSGMVNV